MEQRPPRHEQDPRAILGVDVGAGDDRIRAAYIEKVKQHPPDRDQQQFERIRDAYEQLRDPRRRAERMVFSADPLQELPSLLDEHPVGRRHVGPGPWLAVLKQK